MIAFDKIPNARELGGIRGAAGKTIRHGLIYRTAFLVNASDDDITRLSEEFGIRKVIDLRSEFEVGKQPDRRVPGSEYAHIEIVTLNGHLFKGMHDCFESASCFEEGMAKFIMSPAAKMICDGFYVSFVDDEECQDSIHNFFQEVLATEGPLLFHCTQGKDRTGLCAAFLEHILGVSREDIMKDFLITNESYAHDLAVVGEHLRRMGGGPEEDMCRWTLVGVREQSFLDALDRIDSHYGGMDAYIKNQLRISEADIEVLRGRYLV